MADLLKQCLQLLIRLHLIDPAAQLRRIAVAGRIPRRVFPDLTDPGVFAFKFKLHARMLVFGFYQTEYIQSDLKEYTYLGIVGEQNEEGLYRIEQRNKFSVGEEIEIMKPDGENLTVTVKRIVDEDGADMESAPHPKQVLYIDLGHPLEKYDILRRKE